METVNRLKTWGIVLFYLAFYVPIYQINAGMINFLVNVSALNGSIFMNLVSLGAVLFALIAIHLRPSLKKVAEIVVLVVMVLMVLLLFLLRSQDATWEFNYRTIIMILGLVLFAVAKFAGSVAVKVFDTVGGILVKVFDLLRENPTEVVEVFAQPQTEPTEEDTPEEDLKYE